MEAGPGCKPTLTKPLTSEELASGLLLLQLSQAVGVLPVLGTSAGSTTLRAVDERGIVWHCTLYAETRDAGTGAADTLVLEGLGHSMRSANLQAGDFLVLSKGYVAWFMEYTVKEVCTFRVCILFPTLHVYVQGF